MKYENVSKLWIRGVAPGDTIVGDPKDPQIKRLLAREQIKKQSTSKEGSEQE